MKRYYSFIIGLVILSSCKKSSNGGDPTPPPVTPPSFAFSSLKVNGGFNGFSYINVNYTPVIKIAFQDKVAQSSVAGAITFKNKTGASVPYISSLENNDSTVVIQPSPALIALTQYTLSVATSLKSQKGGSLLSAIDVNFLTQIDSTDKFPVITDNELLDKVQQQTFKYFWDFGHPVSGLARERSNGDNNTVTTGGSGFGIMAIVTAVSRNFITRAEGLTRLQTIVSFLKNTAPRFHGAYSHWLNGATGAVIPFSTNDNGADIVETSYLMAGLLTARQYFSGADAAETTLRADINSLWNGVEWDWFRQNGKKILYWNWSPTAGFAVNVPVQGWNECLITYVLAASSTTHGIPKAVYDSGFARNGAMINNSAFYGYTLPLGPAYGGPLFFSHYSFLGINPTGLSDAYANYATQTKNHTLINYTYCKTNPQNNFGYSELCWGLTASDIPNGYTASSPTNDRGVIAPTAAISSIPYTPVESMNALKFFYYKLGDKLWKQYGFIDAFSLKDLWFADSFLAIDQGPMIVMIENYRSGLIWNLLSNCPEVKAGLTSLGFSAPYL